MNALSLTTVPQASKTMAELNAIVGSGDMHMQDLESAMSTGILPAAKTFGVSLQSVGAALAYMTDTGVPAQMAATRLRMSLSLLGAPSGKAAGLLQTIGLSSKEATARTKAMSDALLAAGLHTTQISADIRRPDGIMVALEDLKKHFESAGVSASAQGAFISAAFGGGRSGSAIMALFNNLDKLQGKYQQIGQTAGSYNKDWSRTQTTLNFQLAQAKGEIESIGVSFGTILIPWVEKGLSGIKDFAHWLDQNRVAADCPRDRDRHVGDGGDRHVPLQRGEEGRDADARLRRDDGPPGSQRGGRRDGRVSRDAARCRRRRECAARDGQRADRRHEIRVRPARLAQQPTRRRRGGPNARRPGRVGSRPGRPGVEGRGNARQGHHRGGECRSGSRGGRSCGRRLLEGDARRWPPGSRACSAA